MSDSRPSDELPIAECRLDAGSWRTQRERYRELAGAVDRLERRPSELLVDFGAGVDERLLEETLGIERECCPFFRLDYAASQRRLRAVVEDGAHDAALDAVAHALGAPERPRTR